MTKKAYITLELWNHGKAGETIIPCGEVDIFNISGTKIPFDLIKELLDESPNGNKFEWFGQLPTEQALKVEAEISCEDSGIWLFISKWQSLPHPN